MTEKEYFTRKLNQDYEQHGKHIDSFELCKLSQDDMKNVFELSSAFYQNGFKYVLRYTIKRTVGENEA